MLAPEIRYRRLLAGVTRLQPASLAERSQPGSIPRACGFPLSLRSLKIEMEVKESSDKKGGSARLYKSLISEPPKTGALPLLHSSVDEALDATVAGSLINQLKRPCLYMYARSLFFEETIEIAFSLGEGSHRAVLTWVDRSTLRTKLKGEESMS